MCANCMDRTTEELVAQTGVSPATMDLLDVLVIAAISLGEDLHKPDAEVTGDPLKIYKEPVAQYVAALERIALEGGIDLKTLMPPDVPLMPMSGLVS